VAAEPDLPEGFDKWPKEVQAKYWQEFHALYFPKLRWWEKPETDEEDSGPRPKQLPPDHPRHAEPDNHGYRCGCSHLIPNCPDCLPCPGNSEWSIWLNCTARGTGKTKAGSNWALEMALSKPGIHVGICAPKYEDVRAVLIEGESGILAEARRNGIEIGQNAYNKNRQEIELQNGSKIRGFSAEKPDSIRGQNLSYCWFDELAMIRYFAFYHEGLMPALRKGDRPRLMITTTPKRVRLIRELLADAVNEAETGVHLTEASSEENVHFSRVQRERLERKYAGTYLLEQEMRGKLVGEADGALFPIEQFNETRVFEDKSRLPQWRRVVVAIDPATTSRDSSDESGIIVMAEGDDGDFYCLEDCSGRFAPDQQMRVVAEAYYRHSADCVVGEVNMTGDYMRALLNTVQQGANIPLRTVHGMRGKVSRAQGPSSLFTQGRIHHVGDNFRQLEDQLSAMAEGDDRSRMHDDRADAWVWAMIHLAGSGQGDWGLVYGFRDCAKCGARVNEDKDKRCANCGAEVTPAAPKHAGGMPARVPWSDAYLKSCPNGHKYTPRERSCPDCAPSPETFIARALAGQGGVGKYSYTGKNWLAGRRF
jgi:predicted phage terminase large subunit-like protein